MRMYWQQLTRYWYQWFTSKVDISPRWKQGDSKRMLRSGSSRPATQRLGYDLSSRLNKSNRCGSVKASLPTSAKLIPSCAATFLIMLAGPLQSASTKIP